jgi:SNF2 family DNA or RNA helicase
VEFVRALYANGKRGAMICADMGTGKSAMAVYTALVHGFQKTLIVCPLRVVQVWKPQFELHSAVPFVVAPLDDSFANVRAKRAEAERQMRLAQARGVPVAVVINFESVWRSPFAEWALRQRWDLMIGDEIHRCKAPGGKASRFLARLGKVARYRIGMTGTPAPHGPLDLYGPLRAVAPAIFGWSFAAFRQRYAIMGGFQNHQVVGYRNLDELNRKFYSIAFRVTKDVLDLPEEIEATYTCELGAEARQAYQALSKNLIAEVRTGIVTAANALVRLLRFAQLTGGFIRTDDGEQIQVDTAKMDLLRDVLEDLDAGEPVVVFCRFRNDLDIVHRVAADLGRGALEISGRRDDLRDWQAGAAPILAVQIQAGGVGIDLTRSRYAIYYSIGFSLGDFLQSKARIHRPGQQRTTEYIFLAAAQTVDEQILRALAVRQDLIEFVLRQTIATDGNGPHRMEPQREG